MDIDEARHDPMPRQVDSWVFLGGVAGDPAAFDRQTCAYDTGGEHHPGSCEDFAPGIGGYGGYGGYGHQAVTSAESRESRSQASSPAPRQPAASPRAAGTMAGRWWKVRRCSTAERSGTKSTSPASARP